MKNNKMDKEKNHQNIQSQDVSSNTSPENESCCPKFIPNIPKINKALLPLKIALFCWHGAGSVIQIFMPVYFKQIGLSTSQQSVINMVSPPIQFLGPAISGLIADKTGRSKIVLQVNVVLTVIFANAMLLIPKIEPLGCLPMTVEVNCSSLTAVTSINERFHKFNYSILALDLKNCSVHCPLQQLSLYEYNFTDISRMHTTASTFSREDAKVLVQNMRHNDTYAAENKTMSLNGSWCETSPLCSFTCSLDHYENCVIKNKDNSTYVYLLCCILLICFHCTFSNCYGIMDVTAMDMVKTHNSDFGRERLWAILSISILSPFAGYLVKITTKNNGQQNYVSSFYFFDAMIVVFMLSVMKLDVKIKPPGQNMWKKTITLIKKPDVLMFAIALLVLGTSWAFHKYFSFLFLDQLNAPSVLLSLLPTASSLAGLPFLATSNWWVKEVGSTNLLILGFFCYTGLCTGYSLLIEPWYALLYQTLEIFTYDLLWVAVIRHSHKIAPVGLTASVISTAGGLHFGIGKATGSCVGLIMGKYGARIAYRFIAVMCAISATLYAIYTFLEFRRHVKDLSSNGNENTQNDLKYLEKVSPN